MTSLSKKIRKIILYLKEKRLKGTVELIAIIRWLTQRFFAKNRTKNCINFAKQIFCSSFSDRGMSGPKIGKNAKVSQKNSSK